MKNGTFSVFIMLTFVLGLAILLSFNGTVSGSPMAVALSESSVESGGLSGTYKSVNGSSAVEFHSSTALRWQPYSYPGTYKKINNEYRLEIWEGTPRTPGQVVVLIAEMDGEDLIITNVSKNGFHIKDMDRERFVK